MWQNALRSSLSGKQDWAPTLDRGHTSRHVRRKQYLGKKSTSLIRTPHRMWDTAWGLIATHGQFWGPVRWVHGRLFLIQTLVFFCNLVSGLIHSPLVTCNCVWSAFFFRSLSWNSCLRADSCPVIASALFSECTVTGSAMHLYIYNLFFGPVTASDSAVRSLSVCAVLRPL